MLRHPREPWDQTGARAATRAVHAGRFIDQHVWPVLISRTAPTNRAPELHTISSEEQFWRGAGTNVLGTVRLSAFSITDWFPRTPGVYWSDYARAARTRVSSARTKTDVELGTYYSPDSKMGLIEEGGIGSIRLRPRKIDGRDCWFATALTGSECHAGIPLVVPHDILDHAAVEWGDTVEVVGTVRFLEDAGLSETAARVHHARPVALFVDELRGVTGRSTQHIEITPVALFDARGEAEWNDGRVQYTFVRCMAGSDVELDGAAEWIERYAAKHHGRVVTNFDEQRPVLAEAPLSYQRLVTKTYDRALINGFHGTIRVERIDAVIQDSSISTIYGDVRMGHQISVGGSANINIDSTLTNVTQTIAASSGLTSEQKAQLESLVRSIGIDLDGIKQSHPDEAREVSAALEKVVTHASKPPQERKSAILDVSAKGLKDAASLVASVAPTILRTAEEIARFVAGLM